MVKIGDVVATSGTEELVNKSNTITEYPVEDGSVVADNSERKPLLLQISGMVKGQNAFKSLQQLRKYADNAELITYTGRNAFSNCIIESLSTSHGKDVKGGFTFTATIKQILIAELQETNINFEVVLPQAINANKSLGKKSVIEEGGVGAYYEYKNNPTYQQMVNAKRAKIELAMTKDATTITPLLDNFTSQRRRKLQPRVYTGTSKILNAYPGGVK